VDVTERLTLEAAASHSLSAVTHLHRYELAAELCAGLPTLDLCCGSGYGSRILRGVCPVVVGIDNAVATIDMAQATIGREDGIEFEVGDAHEVLKRPLSERFGAVVMLEGLEHLVDPESALASVKGHAEAGLRFVISIPNSKTFEEENPFHITDYGFEDAAEICSRFGSATLVYQFVAEGSLIRTAVSSELEASLVEVDRGELEYANHFVVCVNCGLEDAGWASPRMKLIAAPAHTRYMRNLERANAELRHTNARLAREKLGVAESAAASLLARVERLETELEQARARAEEEERAVAHDDWIKHLHAEIDRHRRQVEAMEATRVWRLGRRYWRLRDRLRPPRRRR
jgi:SAM-dependent methyltransferase